MTDDVRTAPRRDVMRKVVVLVLVSSAVLVDSPATSFGQGPARRLVHEVDQRNRRRRTHVRAQHIRRGILLGPEHVGTTGHGPCR